MTAAKHTPLALGPLLKVSVAGSPSYQMRAIVEALPQGRDDGVALVTIRTPFDEKRAAVLAAAPELLEALQALVRWAGYADELLYDHLAEPGTLNVEEPAITAARAAIAKATGSAT